MERQPSQPCPVCGGVVVTTGDYEGHDTEDACTVCPYRAAHSFGLFDEFIGGVWTTWSWDESEEERVNRTMHRQGVLQEARLKWKQEHPKA